MSLAKSFDWGTIKSISPLTVKIDGAVTATPVDVNLNNAAWAVGDRVIWTYVGRKLVVLGDAPERTYVPTLTSTGTNPTGWTTSGIYAKRGQWVDYEATFTATSGFTTGTGAYIFGLPFPVDNSGITPVGIGLITNTDYNYIAVNVDADSDASCRLFRPALTTGEGASGYYGTAWVTNNTVRILGRYRAAS